MKNTQTIAAIATPIGTGGIGIVRISGDKAKDILCKIFMSKEDLSPRIMRLGTLKADGFSDKCLAVYFKSPNSYTGEDVAEFHCHGGRTVITGVLDAVMSCGARLAENGEFTKRAFLNGKMNLAESEAVIDMINAQSAAELSAQYGQMCGYLTREIEKIQSALTDVIGGVEVVLDYPEEDIDSQNIQAELVKIYEKLFVLKDSYKIGGMIKSGVSVCVVGKPNVGKSSLLNSLLGYDRAIVASEAGTTRDIVSESIEINGIRFIISDTAGIRESDNAIENMGVNLSFSSIKSSDIVIFVLDGSKQTTDEDKVILPLLEGKKVIAICNKKDKKGYKKSELCASFLHDYIELSAKNGDGLQSLKDSMFRAVTEGNLTEGGCLLTNERHYDCVARACKVLKEMIETMSRNMSDVIAMQLRETWDILGEITGTTATEEIINNIFSKFCLGK